MGTIKDKLNYLIETRHIFREALNDRGMNISETDTFRSYAEKFRDAPYLVGSYVRCYLNDPTPMPPAGGTRTLHILTDGSHWRIHAPSWLGLSQSEGERDASVTLTFPPRYDIEDYEELTVEVENGLKKDTCKIMLYNAPLAFRTRGVKAEPYTIRSGVTAMTEVGNPGPYVYHYGINEDRTQWRLSNVTDLEEVFSLPSLSNAARLEGKAYLKKVSLPNNEIVSSVDGNCSACFRNNMFLEEVVAYGTPMKGVKNMGEMFRDCKNLTTAILSAWDTSSVTSMYQTFSGCSSLQTLDVSAWDTSSVTNMQQTFYGCSRLQTLDVSNWVLDKCQTVQNMLYNNNALRTLIVDGFDTKAVTNFNWNTSFPALVEIKGRWIGINANISFSGASKLTLDSARVVIDALTDRTGQTPCTVTFHNNVKAQLTDADIATASAKNWNIA